MANKQRGDIPIEINGRKLIMRPSFEAIAEIEDKTGESFMDLASDVLGMAREFKTRAIGQRSNKGAKIAHMAVIISEGIRAGGEFVDKETVGKFIIQNGMAGLLPAVTAFVAVPLAGVDIEGGPEGNGHTDQASKTSQAGPDDEQTGER